MKISKVSALKAIAILVAARAIIVDPHRWTTGENARNIRGESVPATSSKACRFCSQGAMILAHSKIHKRCSYYTHKPAQVALRAMNKMTSAIDPGWINFATYSDKHSHRQALSLFKSAITYLKSG